VEKRRVREVARSTGVSKSWVAVLVARYRDGGYEALAPRSRRPHSVPHRIPDELEDEIVALRKQLVEFGADAGARTIAWHLERRGLRVPAESTIQRVLRRRGFVTPQPRKRPRSSFISFEAQLPNETWQADVTHWSLGDGTSIEILDFIDDHSRLIVACDARRSTSAHDVLSSFERAVQRHGSPASVLTDNAAIFSARRLHGSIRGSQLFETELERRSILVKHSRPYHPQTCGKIERFHQTLKKYLAKQEPACSIAQLQDQLDRFVTYYNTARPHRARERMTPAEAFAARDKAAPGSLVGHVHYRVRIDKVDTTGKVTLRHDGKLFHIGVGRAHAGTPIYLYVADLDVRVVSNEGELLRHLELDPTRNYQGTAREIR